MQNSKGTEGFMSSKPLFHFCLLVTPLSWGNGNTSFSLWFWLHLADCCITAEGPFWKLVQQWIQKLSVARPRLPEPWCWCSLIKNFIFLPIMCPE